MEYGKSIRHLWNLKEDTVYLNHGSFGLTPIEIIDKGYEIEKQAESQPLDFFMETYPYLYKKSIVKLSQFLNCDIKGLVLIENATSGINIILRSLIGKIGKEDKILITNHIYPAVELTLDYICSLTGAEKVKVNIPFPIKDKETILDIVSQHLKVDITYAMFDHITSATGLIFPVKELVDLCKKNEIITIIDGAHSPGMIDLDLSEINSDFYVGNCHKWLFSQKGCAILWVSEKFRSMMHPLTISHFYGEGMNFEFSWTGTRHPSSFLTVTNAIDFYNKMGNEQIRQYNHELVINATNEFLIDFADGFFYNENMIGSILTLPYPSFLEIQKTPMELRAYYWKKYGVELMFTVFENKLCYRIAGQIYNYKDEYQFLKEVFLKEAGNKSLTI